MPGSVPMTASTPDPGEELRQAEQLITQYLEPNLPSDDVFRSVFGRQPTNADDRYLKIALKAGGISSVCSRLEYGTPVADIIDEYKTLDDFNRQHLISLKSHEVSAVLLDPTTSAEDRIAASRKLRALRIQYRPTFADLTDETYCFQPPQITPELNPPHETEPPSRPATSRPDRTTPAHAAHTDRFGPEMEPKLEDYASYRDYLEAYLEYHAPEITSLDHQDLDDSELDSLINLWTTYFSDNGRAFRVNIEQAQDHQIITKPERTKYTDYFTYASRFLSYLLTIRKFRQAPQAEITTPASHLPPYDHFQGQNNEDYAPFRSQAEHDEAARSLEKLLPPDTLFALVFGRPPHSDTDNCPKEDYRHIVWANSDQLEKRDYSFLVLSELSTVIIMGEIMGFTFDDFLLVLRQKLHEAPITDPPPGQELTHAWHRFQQILHDITGTGTSAYSYANLRNALDRGHHSGSQPPRRGS
jgi:hypothetical protein